MSLILIKEVDLGSKLVFELKHLPETLLFSSLFRSFDFRFASPFSLVSLRFSAPFRLEIFLFKILLTSETLIRLLVLASTKSEIHDASQY